MKLKSLFLTAFFVFISTYTNAQTIDGKIIHILENHNITVHLEGKHSFEKGNKIEITYCTEESKRIIGNFEVSTVKGNDITAFMLVLRMEPKKDMKVKVVTISDEEMLLDVYDGKGSRVPGSTLEIKDNMYPDVSLERDVYETPSEDETK